MIGIACWLCFTSSACHRSPIVIVPAQVDIYGFIDLGVITWSAPWSITNLPAHGTIVSEGFLLEYRRLFKAAQKGK
jgi:hypothetical protein